MIKSRWLVIPGALVLCVGSVSVTNSQTQEPSTALYCHGPLSTFRANGGKVVRTPFKWAKEAAGKANPGAGECAWADRLPQESEIKPENAMMGPLGPFDTMPPGTFGKICVYWANSGEGKVLTVREIVRGSDPKLTPFHSPPFSNTGCP
jgi:hypothetical protein